MKKFTYEIPELAEANFGKFVQGASVPGKAGDNDDSTEKL